MLVVVIHLLDNMQQSISKKLVMQLCRQYLTNHGSGVTFMKITFRNEILKNYD